MVGRHASLHDALAWVSMPVGMVFPDAKAVALFGGLVVLLLVLGAWLAFGGAASGTNRGTGAGVASWRSSSRRYLHLFSTASLRAEGGWSWTCHRTATASTGPRSWKTACVRWI
ncbi:MAG: hypothetical protein OXG82_05655 [Gammaproteobacteria bacterium]|nr:hypothetical protein [Gammaproteobacteria bacterium]